MLKHRKITNKVFKLIDRLRFDEALSLIEVERLYSKKDPFYYSIYAIIHLYMNKFSDAKLFVNKALSFNPYHETSLNTLAYTELLEGRVQEAIQIYIKILDINPKNRLVKRNLNRFKTNKGVDKILSSLEPNTYLRSNYVFSYQKVLLVLLLIASLGLSYIYYLYKFPIENISSKREYIKERFRYHTISYIALEDGNKLLQFLENEIPQDNLSDKLITLNKLLASNLDISKKIQIEHNSRGIIYKYNNDGSVIFSYPDKRDLFSKSYLYDSINVVLNGKLKRTGNVEYIIKTFEGDDISLFDYERKIASFSLSKPIKLLIKVNSSKAKHPSAKILSVLN